MCTYHKMKLYLICLLVIACFGDSQGRRRPRVSRGRHPSSVGPTVSSIAEPSGAGLTRPPYAENISRQDVNGTTNNGTIGRLQRPGRGYRIDTTHRLEKEQERIMRIFMIQTEILNRLGLDRKPNTTLLNRLPEEQSSIMKRWYNLTRESNTPMFESNGVYAKHIQYVNAACHPPRKTWVRYFGNRRYLRMYFPISVPKRHDVDRVTKLTAANFHLYKKAVPGHDSTSVTNPNCPPVTCANGTTPNTRPKTRRHRRRHSSNRPIDGRERRTQMQPSEVRRRLVQAGILRPLPNTHTAHATTRLALPKVAPSMPDNLLKISIYRYRKPRSRMELIATQRVAQEFEGKITFNITSLASSWMAEPRKNLGIEVRVEDAQGNWVNPYHVIHMRNCTGVDRDSGNFSRRIRLDRNLTLSNMPNATEMFNMSLFSRDYERAPGIDLETIQQQPEEENTRQKRNAKYKTSCVREPIYVSFEDIGWHNWIVMPQGFETGYCVGTCSRVSVAKSSYRQQLECCGPTRLKPLKVLHFDEKGRSIGISVFDSFIVAECGCRR